MAVNIEIKARLPDRKAVEERAAAVADDPPRILDQEDTFFTTNQGRLKLREERGALPQLIYYERNDARDPKPSSYQLIPVEDPDAVVEVLGRALGIRGRVKKERTLYLAEETRIHLDRVEGLGDYMELEVVLGEGLDREGGMVRARALMAELGIRRSDLVRGAYLDLLDAAGRTGP